MRTEKHQERPRSDGARTLRAWLTERDLSVPKFCEEHALDRITVQRAMNGERLRISVDLAYLIERATEGAVPWHLWRSETRKGDAESSDIDDTGPHVIIDCGAHEKGAA